MSGRILIVGRLQERIDALIAQLAEKGVTNVEGTSDFELALQRARSGDITAVAIGAGLEDEDRLPFADRLREAAPGVSVHVKPDRSGGPDAMIPFVQEVVRKASDRAEPVVPASPEEQRAMLESDNPQLAANKRLVWDMWREFLQGGDIAAADKYLAPDYHQHNPMAKSGREGVKEFFRATGIEKTPVKDYIEGLVAITAERDLVTLALVREGVDANGESYTTTWFDMFRVQDGMLVEHWDNATKP